MAILDLIKEVQLLFFPLEILTSPVVHRAIEVSLHGGNNMIKKHFLILIASLSLLATEGALASKSEATQTKNISTTESPSKFYVTWEEFTHKTLELSQKLPKRSWKGLIAITRGGLAPAAIIAQQLNIRNIDTISISSYDDMDQQKKAEIIKTFSQIPENGGEYWLVVDDLVDTGSTLNIVRDILPKALCHRLRQA